MKFVYFGYDFSVNALMTLLDQGHELLGIQTFPCDNVFSFNQQTKEIAQKLNVPVSETPITEDEIQAYLDQGCETFIAFGYKYKVPPIDPKKAYAINVHPSYLPKARGIMPMPYILLKEPEAAGITVHKMTEEYDAGDILYQKSFKVDATTDIEILSSRAAMTGETMLVEILQDLPRYWKRAKKQKEKHATHYGVPDDDMREIKWNSTVKEIIQKSKAFGHYGTTATIDGNRLAIFNLNGWEEQHECEPGEITLVLPYEFVIAASDGFICLKEFMALPKKEEHTA